MAKHCRIVTAEAFRVSGLAAEGLGWDNAGDNIRPWASAVRGHRSRIPLMLLAVANSGGNRGAIGEMYNPIGRSAEVRRTEVAG